MDIKCVLVSDFEKVCRICMKFAESFLAITSFKIIEMISSCSSVQIWENDDLPHQICNACFLQLQNTINFKQLCETSDYTFRQIIEQNVVKVESDVNDIVIKNEENLNYTSSLINDFPNKVSDSQVRKNEENLNNNSSLLNDFSNEINDNQVKSEENENFFDDSQSLSSLSSSSSSRKVKNENNDEIDIKIITCEICNKEFKKAWVLGQHMHRAHKVKPLKCNKCEMKCYHPLHLKEHEELAHNPLNHTCDICNRQFKDIYKLQRHKFTHSSRSHHCQRCDKSFKDKWSLKKHNQEMHSLIEKNAACHVCGKSILKKNLSIHMQTHKERDKISCEICLKTFFHRQSLENHIKYIHENQAPERNYLCNVCGRAVRSQAELSRHLLIHTKERPYACNHCDKTYRRSEALKMHVSRAHLDERNFVCTFCSQAFYDKKILLNHVRRHTGERPFKCNICDKAFIQKVALRIHMQVHTHSV